MIKNSPLPPCPGDERSKRLLGRKSTGTTPVNSDVWPSIGVRPRGSVGLDKNGREIRFWPNTRPQGTRQRCQSSGWKRKSHLVWQQGRLSSLLCNGDLMNTKKSKFTPPQPTNPLWANGKKCSAIRQKTNIIISQGFISRLPGLQGPGAFQDNSGAESWEECGKTWEETTSAETDVCSSEEDNSWPIDGRKVKLCPTKRRGGGDQMQRGGTSVLSSVLMRLISVRGPETGTEGLATLR